MQKMPFLSTLQCRKGPFNTTMQKTERRQGERERPEEGSAGPGEVPLDPDALRLWPPHRGAIAPRASAPGLPRAAQVASTFQIMTVLSLPPQLTIVRPSCMNLAFITWLECPAPVTLSACSFTQG